MKKVLLTLAIALVALFGCTMSVSAAPVTMPGGTVFDAAYYAQNNPDVVAVLGADEAVLYQHYVTYGINEGRKPCADGAVAAVITTVATPESLSAANATHNYYKGLSAEQAAAADAVAQQIANTILANPEYTTDLQKVSAAAGIVASYCYQDVYGSDAQRWYRSPYGVFIGGVYTCAGSTRALGRVLDYMGYTWIHTNENQYSHQWCVLTMDGQIGFADGMGGIAGYGEMVNGMVLSDGSIIFFY